MAKMHLPAVFEIENHAANDSATPIGGDRGVEMEYAMCAIRAIERTADRAGKRFGTF
jgi:hypothetical protein